MSERSRRLPLHRAPARRVAVVVALVAGLAGGAVRAADSPPPAPWPSSPSASPDLEGWANALRLSGPDRYQTNLALALTLRGRGDYPFDTPDRSSGGATSLDQADDWWGPGTCPRAVIVAAGDSPADSLAASALSDPTGQSSEPYLQRTAAADPLFDPIGGFARVDTDAAPVLVTRSSRQGATALSNAARIAARDLRAGGCRLARQAIVIGGPAAVPAGVDAELVGLGYDEVFRVSGPDRFATAAAVAQSLGTAPASASSCGDPTVDDGDARMAFYANSVVELRDSATQCRLLGRTVVLADGITGADALAAGWWTSLWQVPVVLHDGSDELPSATAAALETLDVDHLVVLGGVARIGERAVDEAVDLTGADVVRVAGDDRYGTAVEMAKRFGGWWPTGDAGDAEASLVCIAASSGNAATATGWPDALGAGPWCGALNLAADGPGSPARALAPTAGAAPTTAGDLVPRPSRDAVPVLLVPTGADALPDAVRDMLTGSFDPAGPWCSSGPVAPGCRTPGFGVVIGGPATVTDAVAAEVSELVSGGSAPGGSALEPRLDAPFLTSLDLGPVFKVEGTGPHRVCSPRDGYAEVRWVSVFADTAAIELLATFDVMQSGGYVRDADGVVRSPSVGTPACVALASAGPVAVRGVSLAGRATEVAEIPTGNADRLTLSGSIVVTGPSAVSGTPSSVDVSAGGTTELTFSSSTPGIDAVARGVSTEVNSAVITLAISRGTDLPGVTAPDRFTATWVLATSLGLVTGSADGEALLDGGTWRLRGAVDITGGTWSIGAGSGGFVADLATGEPSDAGDDRLTWRLDGVVEG